MLCALKSNEKNNMLSWSAEKLSLVGVGKRCREYVSSTYVGYRYGGQNFKKNQKW